MSWWPPRWPWMATLTRIEQKLNRLAQETAMAKVDLSGIKANVARIKELIPAAKAAFDQMAAKIQELIDASAGDTVDKAELQALADDVAAEAADLAAAIPANTPQDPNA